MCDSLNREIFWQVCAEINKRRITSKKFHTISAKAAHWANLDRESIWSNEWTAYHIWTLCVLSFIEVADFKNKNLVLDAATSDFFYVKKINVKRGEWVWHAQCLPILTLWIMVQLRIELRTLRLLGVRYNQLSYRTP